MNAPAVPTVRRPFVMALLLVGVSFAVYANAMQGQFVFDDDATLRRNVLIRSLRGVPRLFLPGSDGYRPVRYASFAIDYAIAGYEPWIYHVSNTLYHGLAAWCVFLVLRRLTRSVPAALAGALLFVVHPVHTESVAYISGRRDILTTLFYLLGFLAYLRYRETGRRRLVAACAGCYLMAFGAKEMAVTLPAIIVLHDVLLDREALRRHWPVYALGFACAGGMVLHAVFVSTVNDPVEYYGESAWRTYLTVGRIWVHFARLLIWPSTLLADYSYDAFPISESILEPRTLVALVVLGAGAVLALACRRRAPLVAFAFGWYAITLLPVSHIVPFHELAAEHYVYLPSVGFCLLVGMGFERLRAMAGSRLACGVLALAIGALAFRTLGRNRDWRDADTIYRVTAEAAPRCARAALNLGVVRDRGGDREGAIECFRRAVAIDPGYILAQFNLAKLLTRTGDVAGANEALEKALERARGMPHPPMPPGEIALALGRYSEAVDLYQRSLEQGSDRSKARCFRGLAVCYGAMGELRRALDADEASLAIDPGQPEVLEHAAACWDRLGNPARAALFRAGIPPSSRGPDGTSPR